MLGSGGLFGAHGLIEDQITIAVLSSEDSNVVGEHGHVDPGSIGAMNCFNWLFIDLGLSLSLEDVLFLNHFAMALTGEDGGGSDATAPAGGAIGWRTTGTSG